MTITLLQGDCRIILPTLPERSVQTVVSSPPYYGLRRYDVEGDQIGDEETPAEYTQGLVAVFREVRRVLRDDGTLWLNLGDSYANDRKWGGKTSGKHAKGLHGGTEIGRRRTNTGLPSKSLMGMPWRVAFALQDDGWVLRSDIIWHKPNVMPENLADRPTKAHEYIFLFSKQERYFYNAAAVAEPSVSNHGSGNGFKRSARLSYQNGDGTARGNEQPWRPTTTRRQRSVWSIPVKKAPGVMHFATFPEALIEPCILAGSRPGDTVLDPFVGSGTTCRVAERFGRNSIGIDLGYLDLQEQRTNGVQVHMEAFL